MLKVQFGGPFKELDIFFIGKRIAAFDIVDTNFIEPLRDLQFVLEGQTDALALGSVPECRVVNLNGFHTTGFQLNQSRQNRGEVTPAFIGDI